MQRDIKPVNASEITCPDCNAKPGERCASLIDASVYLDIAHAGRRKLAQGAR